MGLWNCYWLVYAKGSVIGGFVGWMENQDEKSSFSICMLAISTCVWWIQWGSRFPFEASILEVGMEGFILFVELVEWSEIS